MLDVVVEEWDLLEVHVAAGHVGSLVSRLENVDLNDVLFELGVLAGLNASLSLFLVLELDVTVAEGLAVTVGPEGGGDDHSELLQEGLELFLIDRGVDVLDEEVGLLVQLVSVDNDGHEVHLLATDGSVLEVLEGSLGILGALEGHEGIISSPLFQSVVWMRNVDDVISVKMLINLFC